MFEWLLDYQKLDNEIDYLEYQLQREKRELKRWVSGDLSDVKLERNSKGANVEERIEAIEYELAHKMNDQYNAKKLISTFKGLENQIMYGKYVEGKTLISIADELNFSPNYIYNKHAEIMKRIDFAHQIS